MKSLFYFLTFALLFSCPIAAAAQKSSPAATKNDKPATSIVSGKVTAVNPQAKTYTVLLNGKEAVFSVATASALPKIGSTVKFSVDTRLAYKDCTLCGLSCSGSCIENNGSCLCYLDYTNSTN